MLTFPGHPVGIATRAQGGGPWSATLASLRALLSGNEGADNPHSLAAMVAPPTISTSTSSSLLSGITGLQARWTTMPEKFQVSPGEQEVLASTYLRLYSATRSGSLKDRSSFKISAVCDAQNVGLQITGHADVYRFLVDDQYVDFAGTLTSSTASPHYVKIAFASKASRKITVEMQGDQGFHAMFVATGDTITIPGAEDWNIAVVGDSFTDGTGTGASNNLKGDGFAAVLADYLGIKQRLMSGVGSTGYSLGPGLSPARYKLSERVAADVAGKGPFDVVVVAMGINDNASPGSVTSDANAAFDLIRSGNPAAVVFVLGPWDKNAPSAAESGYSTCKANIQAAVAGRGGFYFIDVEGVDYEKVGGGDTPHPSTAGHIALGEEVAGLIRAAVSPA